MLGRPSSPDQFRVEYSMDIVRQSAWLVINPSTVYIDGFLFDWKTVCPASYQKSHWPTICLMLIFGWAYRCSTLAFLYLDLHVLGDDALIS